MKRLDMTNLRKSAITYIFTGMFLLIVIAIYSISMTTKNVQDKKEFIYSKQVSSSIKNVNDIGDFLNSSMYKLYALMLFILFIITYFIYRRIGSYQDSIEAIYIEANKKLEFNRNYLKSAFDATPHIMILTNGKDIETANSTMLEFFKYKTLNDFKKDHDCICDFFIDGENCLKVKVDDTDWLEYIISNPDQTHKVYMLQDEKKHSFTLKAHTLNIDSNIRYVVTFNDITEVEELGRRLEIAVNGTNDGLWDWNLQTGELYFSPQWKKQLGYEDDELKNELSTWQNHVHPKDKDRAIEDYTANMEGKTSFYHNIHRLRHKDGSWVWILDRGQTIFDENKKAIRMVGFHTDITKQKELEKQLLDAKLEFDMFMRFIPASILIKDRDGVIIYANKKSNEFFNQEDIIGKTARDLLPLEIAKEVELSDKKIIENGKYEEVKEIYDADGKLVITRTLGFKLEVNNNLHVGLVMIDITQSYLDKKELENKDEIMIAQSRHAAMGEMISMIAHQWRQPISVIAMDANNIIVDVELSFLNEKDLLSSAKDILKQTQELSKTIDDFRDFFKPNKNANKIFLKQVLDDALGVIGTSLQSSNIEVELNIDESIEIKTFSRELMQVFINIIKNAKEILIEKDIDKKAISINFTKDKKFIKIEICDNANGIDSKIIKNIFNPYFTTKGEKNGTGLGLYMSKTIVEKHLGGVIQAYNKNDGACFEIRLPYNIDNIN